MGLGASGRTRRPSVETRSVFVFFGAAFGRPPDEQQNDPNDCQDQELPPAGAPAIVETPCSHGKAWHEEGEREDPRESLAGFVSVADGPGDAGRPAKQKEKELEPPELGPSGSTGEGSVLGETGRDRFAEAQRESPTRPQD